MEEPLPAGGSCLLGSLNLSEFVNDDKSFNFNEFTKAVIIAVRGLNDVLIEGMPLHPLKEQRKSVNNWRQIGLGICGLADMLIKMEIPYGSKESLELCDKIGHTMARNSIRASIDIAMETNPFPKFTEVSPKCIRESAFFENNVSLDDKMFDSDGLYSDLEKYGMANSQLLTIAPTGTISTMLGISGGIEPIFANSYTRKTESLHGTDKYYKVYTPIVDKYMKEHGLTNESELPDWFITAADLNYHQRIDMQAIWQSHIDASISSTVNVPNNFTPEQVFDLYLEAWKKGCKGITIFRDGCKRTGILTTESSNTKQESAALKRGEIEPASDELLGLKRKLNTGCGTLHLQGWYDPLTFELREIYLSKGSTGGCANYMIGLSRMISLAARAGVGLDDIIDQLKSTGSCPSYAARAATQHDTSKGSCCAMAIGYALRDMQNDLDGTSTSTSKPKKDKHVCPECGEPLIFEGGCNICKACGWTKCD